jgi:hypothetical protein
VVTAELTEVTTRERERPAALHEYRLLDSPAGDELEAVVRVAGVPAATLNLIDDVPARPAAVAGRA